MLLTSIKFHASLMGFEWSVHFEQVRFPHYTICYKAQRLVVLRIREFQGSWGKEPSLHSSRPSRISLRETHVLLN